VITKQYTQSEVLNIKELVSSCGLEILNEIWAYNIKSDTWTYIKPYVDTQNSIPQKPQPRYGHSAVYVELLDTTIPSKPILRKYMYIYGGFSIYCDNACDDMWAYEIAYAPQRYYPQENKEKWNRGNRWSQIYVSTVNSPGKRVHHSMVVDERSQYIYLYGGVVFDKDGKQTLATDLWRYEIGTNTWQMLATLGIASVTRNVIFVLNTYRFIFGMVRLKR
jgi:hypothetical protein